MCKNFQSAKTLVPSSDNICTVFKWKLTFFPKFEKFLTFQQKQSRRHFQHVVCLSYDIALAHECKRWNIYSLRTHFNFTSKDAFLVDWRVEWVLVVICNIILKRFNVSNMTQLYNNGITKKRYFLKPSYGWELRICPLLDAQGFKYTQK